ncbi:ANTAR domain-containing response regulator [Propionivibrio sp.]|uniref:ANTAR domain-containing response regulator n=1 Tax=Propionivibrio sp. TaxID=2212460 RepID=UPI003BF368E6
MTRILIADDDRLVLLTLADGLREAGFEVIEAHDGLQALALCLSEEPALALLDIRMPGLDGLELARRLRDETTVPFLFFSAYDDEEFVQRAVEIGALGYLIKPLTVAKIVPTIRTALARAQEISGLQGAMASNRTIATAVGMLMRAAGLDQPSAFEQLRQQARTQRRKLEDVARSMVEDDKYQKP